MSHRIPKNYTILISQTGKAPITLSFRPLAMFLGGTIAIAIPLVAIGSVVYSYAHRNHVLTQRNTMLTQEATSILDRLETIETEINNLQQRAGVSDTHSDPTDQSSIPQGGEEISVQAETLLAEAKTLLPHLSEDLKEEVTPALEQTLLREAARPHGIPLNVSTEITSTFGLRPSPFGWGFEFHNGLDFKGDYGIPIHTTAAGVVEVAEFSGGYGYHVIVNHGYGYRTLYAHMSKLEVAQGALIQKNQVVGYLGSTGRSTGPHLHYTVYYNGKAVDPQAYLDYTPDLHS